jgi:excisionase family DNA binding protein
MHRVHHPEDHNTPSTTPWLSVPEGAARALVSPRTIYDACRRGQLRHARVGGRKSIRLRPEWVDEWLLAGVPREVQR